MIKKTNYYDIIFIIKGDNMREATGTTWIFGLVLSFTLIFSGFLVLAISYSKAYKLKNEMTSIIEKYEGITYNPSNKLDSSINIINSYLTNSNYTAKGHCIKSESPNKTYGAISLDGSLSIVNDSKEYYYCITEKKNKTNNTTIYEITLFYDFNLPVFGHLRQFSITGQTNEIYNAYTKLK